MDDQTFAAMLERASEPVPDEILVATVDAVRDALARDLPTATRRRARRRRFLAVSAAAAVVAVVVAGSIVLGDDSDRVVRSGPAATADPTTTTSSPVDAEVPLTGSPPPEAPYAEDCPPPFVPLGSVDRYSGSTSTLPVPEGENVLQQPYAPAVPEVDSDGDGRPDEIAPKQDAFSPALVTRGDGVLRFEWDTTTVMVTVSGLPDLDGDGRDELGVGVHEPEEYGPPLGFYVVPGVTEPGTYDPREVGIRLARVVAGFADRDGDGVEDLIDIGGSTRILSGAAVGAVDAPGDARGIEPLLFLPGDMIGVADLGGDAPAVVTGEVASLDGPGTLYVAQDDGVRRFTTAPEPWVGNYTSRFGTPQVVVAEGGTFLVVSQSDRSAARSYVWRLDSPCTPL